VSADEKSGAVLGLAALFCAAGYSALDEIHQALWRVALRLRMIPCLILRGVRAFAALWLWFRWRRSVGEAEFAARKMPSA